MKIIRRKKIYQYPYMCGIHNFQSKLPSEINLHNELLPHRINGSIQCPKCKHQNSFRDKRQKQKTINCENCNRRIKLGTWLLDEYEYEYR